QPVIYHRAAGLGDLCERQMRAPGPVLPGRHVEIVDAGEVDAEPFGEDRPDEDQRHVVAAAGLQHQRGGFQLAEAEFQMRAVGDLVAAAPAMPGGEELAAAFGQRSGETVEEAAHYRSL